MGRYYSSASGEVSGKFGFGVQDSDAGLRFGMVELDEDASGMELFQDNAEEVLKEIEKIFDEMGSVPCIVAFRLDSLSVSWYYFSNKN